ncbi:Crp/Fnr family transcriptional regulator [Natroniella sulfidigena]|uniref:Crp/Fnr family transcriptional regulator n=1 Tax=Natroniella sulfidigena TaxID=723921 RepID=UPI00200A79FD|nr:Crp/Fnr family transcriptional regulator [Natroniella sulfidigena]MCK8817245.1 Crp/Fnr family transcriptional regulator [Natroniella sulfidigena]
MAEISLRDYNYFSELTADELEEIQNILHIKEYKEGEIIFFEEEPGEALFLVQEGRVKLIKMIESGEEQILNILKQGSMFAEVVLFDGGTYPATAIVLEDSMIGVINKKDMIELIERIPDIALKILKVMSKRLRRAQKMVQNLGLRDTTSRTASILVYLVKEHGITDQDQLEINLSLTQQELASMIGTSRETVSRVLNKFKTEELIDTSRQKIIITDLEGLKEFI